MSPQRVLIVANDNKPPTAEGLAAAFGRRGIRASLFYSRSHNSLYDRLVIHTVNHYAHTLRLAPKTVDLFEGHPFSHKEVRCRELLRQSRAFAPNLVLLLRGIRYKPETLRELGQISALFCWYTESEDRFPEIEPELPLYRHIYFFSSRSLELARQRGFQNVGLLQHAVDTSRFYPLKVRKKYDWSFVGTWHERRQRYIEGLKEVSSNFVIYGPNWRRSNFRNPSLWLRIRGEGIWGEPLTRLYNQTRVVVNISVWGKEQQKGGGVNMRLLEVPACRACLLTDDSQDAEFLLTPGEDFASASSLPEMQRKLAELLADEELRNRMAANGFARASRVRTYDHLVEEIIRDWAARPGNSS